MNSFKEYKSSIEFPYYDEPIEFLFNNIDELLNNSHIKSFCDRHDFHRFSIDEDTLIVEYDNGYDWYVIGYIKYPELLQLEKWNYKER